LPAFAEQIGDGPFDMLTEQIEQGCLDRGERVNRDALVKRLQAASAGIAIAEALTHVVHDGIVRPDRLANHE
jgi:hypothetical protein